MHLGKPSSYSKGLFYLAWGLYFGIVAEGWDAAQWLSVCLICRRFSFYSPVCKTTNQTKWNWGGFSSDLLRSIKWDSILRILCKLWAYVYIELFDCFYDLFFFNLFLVAKEIKYITLTNADNKENVESKSAVPSGPHVTPMPFLHLLNWTTTTKVVLQHCYYHLSHHKKTD